MKSVSASAFGAFALLVCTTPAFAQGDDNCATAQILTAVGTYAFDNTAATTDGPAHTQCNGFSSLTAEQDVWWSFTAPSSGLYEFSTCGQATMDTIIAVYDGTCGGTLLGCNDDFCSVQSTVRFSGLGGSTYLLRLGRYVTSTASTGTMTIDIVPPPQIQLTAVNPANNHTYHLLEGSSWTAAETQAVALGGHLVTVNDQAEQDWIVQTFHLFQPQGIDIWSGFTDAASEGNYVWVSGQPVTYTNWDLNEPNNANGNENYMALRQNNPLALWNDLADAPTGFHANPHGLVELEPSAGLAFCFGDGTFTDHTSACPCANDGAPGNGCAHSFNPAGTNLTATGSVPADDIVLATSGEPATSFTLFLQHASSGDTVFHDGVLCAGGTLIRLRGRAAVGGQAFFPNASFPQDQTITLSQRGGVFPGQGVTRYYTAWFRNASTSFCPPATANVSNGWKIDW